MELRIPDKLGCYATLWRDFSVFDTQSGLRLIEIFAASRNKVFCRPFTGESVSLG